MRTENEMIERIRDYREVDCNKKALLLLEQVEARAARKGFTLALEHVRAAIEMRRAMRREAFDGRFPVGAHVSPSDILKTRELFVGGFILADGNRVFLLPHSGHEGFLYSDAWGGDRLCAKVADVYCYSRVSGGRASTFKKCVMDIFSITGWGCEKSIFLGAVGFDAVEEMDEDSVQCFRKELALIKSDRRNPLKPYVTIG